MAISTLPVVLLLLFGLLCILLLTIPSQDVRDAPGLRVRSAPQGTSALVVLYGSETLSK